MKPFIGLTAHIDNGSPEDLYPGHPLIYTDRHYTEAIEDHEMFVVILPAVKNYTGIPFYLERLDGIVFTGGGFLNLENPLNPTSMLKETGGERFTFEKALLIEALQLNMPVLGICRGMQMINEILGGTLKTLSNGDHHQEIKGITGSTPTHDMTIGLGSKLAFMMGVRDISINSFHRQVIDITGKGLRVCGRSSKDGFIEAIESDDHSWVFGVQFHPEQLYNGNKRWSQLFNGFRKAAVAYREDKDT